MSHNYHRTHGAAAVIAAVLLPALAGYSCRPKTAAGNTYVFEGETMGTTYTVKVVSEGLAPNQLDRLEKIIGEELEDVNRKMSHYREDSELSTFNRYRDAAPFPISGQTFQVFQEAESISVLTGGAFDVTAAPLINLWGFGPTPPQDTLDTLPSDEAIAEARDRVGYEKLVLDENGPTLRKLDPRLECDLSAIAKGYGVDRVAEALSSEGLPDYMVEVGGEIRSSGKNDAGEAWRIAIERPVPGESVVQRIIPLSGSAMATSGGYRNFYEKDGKRYSHTIDPRTGRPVTHALASVSVIDRTCARADGLATGLLVLGPEEGYALAVEHDLAALFVVAERDGFRERATPAFEAFEKGVQ